MSKAPSTNEFESAPTAEEVEKMVKRMSAGAAAQGQVSGASVPKDDKVLKIATFTLQKYLKEPDFAAEFLQRGGVESLCDIIRKATGNTLAYALNSFTSLMTHDLGWNSVTQDFITDIAHIIVSETLVTICRPATAILINVVCTDNSKATSLASLPDSGQACIVGYSAIHKVLKQEPELIPTLVQRLQSPDYTLCLNSLVLLTVMLKFVTDEFRSELMEAMDTHHVLKHIVRLMNGQPSIEFREQLLDFQSAYILNVNRRRKTQISLHNKRHVQMLNDIYDAAKVSDINVSGSKKWRKIGFSSEVPQREFGRTGVFGLERMHNFATENKDLFAKMILEHIHRPEDKGCPFAKASIEVTDVLCSHWNINTGYIAADFEPLLLNFDHVQSTTLQLFFRLFQDMEATTSDFSKVSALVRSQLRAILKSDGIKDVYEFDRIMLGTPYQVIRDRRLKELEWADDLLGREAIKNVRTRLNRQSYEFIKHQRISCLLQGAWFRRPMSSQRMGALGASTTGTVYNATGSSSAPGGAASLSAMSPALGSGSPSQANGKRWRYYKLSRSKKVLHYGDFQDNFPAIINSYESLTNKVDLSSIVEIKPINRKPSLAGLTLSMSSSATSQPSMPSVTSSDNASLSFALMGDGNVTLAEFICSSSAQVSEWKDGFSMLLDKGITSKDTAEYLHSLTEIGVKVKLLQIAGDRVEVPHGQVDVPPVPPGLGSDFYYNV